MLEGLATAWPHKDRRVWDEMWARGIDSNSWELAARSNSIWALGALSCASRGMIVSGRAEVIVEYGKLFQPQPALISTEELSVLMSAVGCDPWRTLYWSIMDIAAGAEVALGF